MTPLRSLLLALALSPLAGPLVAQDAASISDDDTIREGLISAAITYEIGRVCDGLETRKGPGVLFLLSLQSRALSLGFSPEEVRDYMNDDAEKARLEGIARERAAGLGIVEGEPDTYCAVGRAEMAKGSLIGRYLAEG